MNYAEGG